MISQIYIGYTNNGNDEKTIEIKIVYKLIIYETPNFYCRVVNDVNTTFTNENKSETRSQGFFYENRYGERNNIIEVTELGTRYINNPTDEDSMEASVLQKKNI